MGHVSLIQNDMSVLSSVFLFSPHDLLRKLEKYYELTTRLGTMDFSLTKKIWLVGSCWVISIHYNCSGDNPPSPSGHRLKNGIRRALRVTTQDSFSTTLIQILKMEDPLNPIA